MEIINPTTKVKARKTHTCSFCGFEINKGNYYHVSVIKNGGDIYSWKSHLECGRLYRELKMYEDADDGVTSEDFYEHITSTYIALNPDKSKNLPEFKERLHFLINH